MSLPFITGIAGLAITGSLMAYLRWRTRHVEAGLQFTHEFSVLARQLIMTDLPDRKRIALDRIASAVGTGYVTRRLISALASGKMGSAISRDDVSEMRADWADHPRAIRVKYTQAIFAALLADSYYAGLLGTVFRRTFFYARPDAAEIAKSVDAYETKVLLVGADRAASKRLGDSDACASEVFAPT